MTEQDQKQLGKTLWNIADQLRGSMNADDFRDYMLSFLFLRYLSEQLRGGGKEGTGSGLPGPQRDRQRRENAAIRLVQEQPRDVAAFEKQMQRKVHYVVKPQYLWGNIVHLAKTQDEKLLDTLQKGFQVHRGGIVLEQLPRAVLGDQSRVGQARPEVRRPQREAVLDHPGDRGGDGDVLDRHRHAGRCLRVPDRAVRRGIGEEGGRVLHAAADFEHPLRHRHARQPGAEDRQSKRLDSVFDFACGSGSLLLNVRHRMGSTGTIGKIFGQEKNITTYNLARMNMLLHGVKDTEFEIYHGDTLTNDWDMLREMNPAKMPKFDAVVANPPFSYRWEPSEAMGEDVRFKNYGSPQERGRLRVPAARLHYLKDDGVMAIILPHGVLFRGGAEERIRTKLLEGRAHRYRDRPAGEPVLFDGDSGLHPRAEEVQEAG
jgi:type I restriction enzyme M protein